MEDALHGAEEWECGEERWAQERRSAWSAPPYDPPYGLPKPRSDVWGYKDPVSGQRYEPRYGPCAICGLTLEPADVENLKTLQVVRDGDRREWFYRVHRDCRDPVVEMQIEASIGGRAK